MSNKFKEQIWPPLVLLLITLAVTCALVYTQSITKDAIAENKVKTIKEAEGQVLKDGKGEAKQVTVKSYGGDLTVMIGIDPEGKVSGVTVISHSDTPGLGTKAMEPEYLKQYIGVSQLKEAKINDDKNIDAITGATISSNAVYEAVKEALGGAANE